MSLEAVPARTRITDDVYSRLLAAILDHALPPGGRLSVPALAAKLQVSRTPVREAVIRLIREGLAVEEPRRGAVLAQFDSADLVRIYEVREALEGMASRLAATRATTAQRVELREIFDEHADAVRRQDYGRHFELDMRFHALVREAAGNEDLAALLDQIQIKIRIAMVTTVVSSGPGEALADHERILSAIEARAPRRAEDAAGKHIRRLRELLEQELEA